jgi:hypothetical protein
MFHSIYSNYAQPNVYYAHFINRMTAKWLQTGEGRSWWNKLLAMKRARKQSRTLSTEPTIVFVR